MVSKICLVECLLSFFTTICGTVALLAGVALSAFLCAMTWSQNRKIQATLDDRLVQIQTTVAQLSAKVDAGARAAAQPRQQGPGVSRGRAYHEADGARAADVKVSRGSELRRGAYALFRALLVAAGAVAAFWWIVP
jgi:hypothetical protein